MKTSDEESNDSYLTVPHWQSRIQKHGFMMLKGAYHLVEYVDDLGRWLEYQELRPLFRAFDFVIGPIGRIAVCCTIGLAAAALHEILFRR